MSDDKGEGVGTEGTIPDSEDGLAVGVTGEVSSFTPEEDPPDESDEWDLPAESD
ncbi:hypothetical protein [Rathayibacter toxicus]|uniref:hypothetical protein n=1 Tax=Rathayibacter toxicus TaxID=145458 RepID=UPI0004200875|nr:hypothetical protein [Rathayibacter toxicus]QOD08558.1 hypothetical protein AYW78_01375 [Rathayibacter toxicus]QOD10662.1 hypothetical protein BSG36_01305 [Rathayibacter toxicus]